MSAQAPSGGNSAPTQMRDERTLLKISLLDNNQSDASYEVSLLTVEGNREFGVELSELHPAYYQLCLFQDRNPKKARRIQIRQGNLEGSMQGRFQFDEETLRQEATVTLSPIPELDQHGEEIPGKGQAEELKIELRAVSVYQDPEEHQGGIVLKFEELKLAQSIKAFAKARQSVIPDAYQTRELMLCARVGQQMVETDLEQPEQFKPLFLYASSLHHTTIQFTVEERIYKLERDEQAMLKRISTTNIKAMGVDAFLYDRLGGKMGELKARADEVKGEGGTSGQAAMSLDAIIDKKKVYQQTKVLLTGQMVGLATIFSKQLDSMGLAQTFEATIDAKTSITGSARLCCNAFTAMPKGQFSLTIEDKSNMSKVADSSTPENTVLARVEGLVLRVSKQVNIDGERLVYRLGEPELAKKQQLEFDSAFFDDSVKVQVYQKNSTAKVNKIGQITIPLAEFVFENLDDADEELYPVTLKDKKTGFESGTLFIKINYKPMDTALLSPAWPEKVRSAGQLSDKYEFFNDFLTNEFKDDCQFGFLKMELDSLTIPPMQDSSAAGQRATYKRQQSAAASEGTSKLNEIFMIRIKIGAESNTIFVASPNRILDQVHQSMTANIDSINDKIYVEFYDVLNEQAFDPRSSNARTDLSNLKMLSHRIFDVRDLAFNSEGQAQGHRVLMPVEHSGNVASFTFNALFQKNVPAPFVEKPLSPSTRYLLIVRMVQSVKEALHHHEDLDKVKIIGEVRNMTREAKPISKRLFFNKELLAMGNLEFETGDELKMTFAIQRHGSDGIETVPFQENDYIVTEAGLAPSVQPVGSKNDGLTTLQTWVANQVSVPFNFSKETQFMQAYRKKKQGGNTLGNVLQNETVLLKDVRLELEVRDSDLVQINSRGHLESCFVKVMLGRSSIVDCLLAQDLTQDTSVTIQMISEDRRSLRFRRQIELSEFDFDDEIELRLFRADDVVQLNFANDLEEFFVSLKCAELPLSLSDAVVWFAQIKTKQVRVELQLYQDEALIPVNLSAQEGTQAKGKKPMIDAVADKLKLDLKAKQEMQRDQKELQEKMKQLEGKSEAQKVLLLKQFVNEQKMKNRKLITKQLRVKKATENHLKLIEEAKLVKPQPVVKKPEAEPDMLTEFKSLVSRQGSSFQQSQEAKKPKLAMSGALAKKNASEIQICSCGNLNPLHRGYCSDCVRKLKARYDQLLTDFEALQQEADDFNKVDMDKANEKLQLMRNKAEQYEIKLSDVQMLDVLDRHQRLADTDESRAFAERKVYINSLKQELEILLFKQQIEIEDFQKQKKWLDDRITAKQRQKKDQERETNMFMYEFDKVNNELEAIKNRMHLKKRYVVQHQQVQAAKAQQEAQKLKYMPASKKTAAAV